MKPIPPPRWTIRELTERVADALAVDYDGQKNGQVRDVPGTRAIRYYTTLGLLDRAAEMRGRTALYGRRHLLQLVAVKRLQAEGRSLADIQAELVGATDGKLEAIAALPEGALPSAEKRERKDVATRAREAFWAADAAPVRERAPVREKDVASSSPTGGPRLLTPIQLDADLTLLVNAEREATAQDLEAIREAAATLRAFLETRGLLSPSKGEPDEPRDRDPE